MSRLAEFYRAHPEHTPTAPVPDVAAGIARYRRAMGLPPDMLDYSGVAVDPRRGAAIGKAYDELPFYDKAAEPAYRAMREETGRQFEFLTGQRSRGGLGIDVSVQEDDPYDTPSAMRSDLREGRLSVLATRSTGGHPFFADDENDMFRAVHDAFGHAGTGRGFDRHGEEAAWTAHSQMYSPFARQAMTSETRGQNSAFIFNSGGKIFPVQKVAVLPEIYTDSRAGGGRRTAGASLGRQFGSV